MSLRSDGYLRLNLLCWKFADPSPQKATCKETRKSMRRQLITLVHSKKRLSERQTEDPKEQFSRPSATVDLALMLSSKPVLQKVIVSTINFLKRQTIQTRCAVVALLQEECRNINFRVKTWSQSRQGRRLSRTCVNRLLYQFTKMWYSLLLKWQRSHPDDYRIRIDRRCHPTFWFPQMVYAWKSTRFSSRSDLCKSNPHFATNLRTHLWNHDFRFSWSGSGV